MSVRRSLAIHKPYPELVEPVAKLVPYEVIDTNGKRLPTNGMTSLEKRIFMVPFDAEHYSVALHELGHVRWSPERLPKIDFDRRFVMAVEDARINLGLELFGLPILLGQKERLDVGELARDDLKRRDALGFALRSIAALGTNAEDPILAALEQTRNRSLAEIVVARLARVRRSLLHGRSIRRSEVASFALVLRLAEELAKELGREVSALGYSDSLPVMIECEDDTCCLGGHRGFETLEKRKRLAAQGRQAPDCRPGHLVISTPLLPHDSPRPRGGRRGASRACEKGDLMRYPHRFLIDQAIFRRSTRVFGGTVLIDTSGSMSLDAAAIDQILLAAATGATLIAIYSGKDDRGELRIIAKDDKRADPKDLVPFGKGNIVDEPALAWVARQAEPRIWISDGGVTGIGDTPSHEMTERCAEIVRRGHILRVNSLQEAAATLARWRPNARTSPPSSAHAS